MKQPQSGRRNGKEPPWRRDDAPRVTPLDTYIIRFCYEKSSLGLTDRTVLTYWHHLRRLTECFDIMMYRHPKELSENDVDDLCRGYLAIHAGQITVNSHIRTFNSFYSWLYKAKVIDSPVRFALGRVDRLPVLCFEMDEIDRLVAAPVQGASFEVWRDWAIVRFALATGARRSNILELRMRDISFSEHSVILVKTKGRRAMLLPLSKHLEDTLRVYVEMRNPAGPSDFVFATESGGQLSASGLRHRLDKYYRDRGISLEGRKSGAHILRHTFARYAARNMPTGELQRILGHSQLSTTEAYIHFTFADLRADLETKYDILASVPHGRTVDSKVEMPPECTPRETERIGIASEDLGRGSQR